ncbi:hypothetical protein BC939DRAFT_449067 [Gamsiella multidivaricata]|uniref:uncharacterized protein n=1 Tax=Gamsiella multidivaricata TaxID=101098 RepID=UPI00221ED463|nr:uncharacterized protein BC939DRAFT_449067 [Gamsiella multidivaricata]KAI7825227.1 hypothetical protein BC939DRAFT_449067 [Gamsiella multidivaricata]
MDTAVMKSWYEVVRLNDPFIWNLAAEGSCSLKAADEGVCLPHLQHLHQHTQLVSTAHVFPHPSLTLSSASVAKESNSVAAAAAALLQRSTHCKALLDPQPQNALDWLKCLIQPSQDAALNGNDQGHLHPSRKELRALLNTHVDLREAFSKGAESGKGGIHGCSHGAEEAASKPSSSATPPHPSYNSEGSLPHHPHRQSPGTRAYPTPTFSNSYFVSSSESHAAGREDVASFAAAVAPTAGVPSASSSPSMVADPVTNASIAQVATAVTSAGETETGSSNPLAAEQPTEIAANTNVAVSAAAPLATTMHTLPSSSSPSASSNSPSPASLITSSNTAVNAAIDKDTAMQTSNTSTQTTTNDNSNSTGTTADIPPSSSTATTPTSGTPITPSRTSTLVLSSSATLYSVATMAQDGLVRSKDATTAFFYRTFSPTYRISRLYIDSWTNGSQRRGLERIKNSVVRGDALTLVKGTTTHMKDVWKQVMTAYRVKSANITAKAAADGRGKNKSKSKSKSKKKNHDRENNSADEDSKTRP